MFCHTHSDFLGYNNIEYDRSHTSIYADIRMSAYVCKLLVLHLNVQVITATLYHLQYAKEGSQ